MADPVQAQYRQLKKMRIVSVTVYVRVPQCLDSVSHADIGMMVSAAVNRGSDLAASAMDSRDISLTECVEESSAS